MSKWFLKFDAIDPEDTDGRWTVGIQEAHFRRLQHHGHEMALARIVLVDELLSGETERLYRGWSRPEKEDCFVYAGRPNRDYRSLSIQVPAPPGKMFLVFVLPGGRVEHWTWREFDPETGGPKHVTGEMIWPPM